MANSLPQVTLEKYVIEIVDGPDRGAQFQVFSGDIKLGRGDSNDIVLNDARCSREHAVLKITPQAVYIEDNNSQNGVTVDGQKAARSFLSHGSKVSLGSTTFIFKKVAATKPNLSIAGRESFSRETLPVGFFRNITQDPKKLRFYLILIGVVVVALFLISGQSTPKKPVVKAISTDEEIDSSKKRQDALLKEQMLSGKASRQYLDAQATFTKGLRDYREGLFKSAVSSFSATLAIYPEHPTARRYLRLAQLKLDEQIQLMVQEGNRYMDQGLYQNAKAAYSQVMILVGDKENKIYQEARTKYNECVLILRESF